jgi:hypothetical protein
MDVAAFFHQSGEPRRHKVQNPRRVPCGVFHSSNGDAQNIEAVRCLRPQSVTHGSHTYLTFRRHTGLKAKSCIALGSAPPNISNSTRLHALMRVNPSTIITNGTPSRFTTSCFLWQIPASDRMRQRTCNTATSPLSKMRRRVKGFHTCSTRSNRKGHLCPLSLKPVRGEPASAA